MQTRSRVHPALAQVGIIRVYQQVLFDMVEDLEKGKAEAVSWFRDDRENVALVATAAGFSPESIFQKICDPLRDGVPVRVIVKRIRDARVSLQS